MAPAGATAWTGTCAAPRRWRRRERRPPDRRPWYDHRATALHWAVLGDRGDSVAALLAAGAGPSLCDTSFDSTPRGWAEHLGKSAALAAFPS